MKVAVTGTTGFVGPHVLSELQRRSVPATAIVRPLSAISGSLSKHSIVRMDVEDTDQKLFERMGEPDVLIHLAWGGLPNYKSSHHLDRELATQQRFLGGLVESGLRNLVVAGTCFEYGMASGQLREDMEAIPANPYGMAKDALRRWLESLKNGASFSLTWARVFYLYGEGQPEGSLLPQLKKAVERGDPVFRMSGGEQLRDYLPVAEAAKYLVSLALGGKDNGIVNVCSGEPISVRNLVEGWIKNNRWSIRLDLGYYPYPDHEPMAFWGDRQKLDRCLNVE